VGTVRKAFLADRVVSNASRTAAVDTRPCDQQRTVSCAELLPFAYDTSWWTGATSIGSMRVTPLTNGVPVTARQVAVPVTNAVGTGVWTPTHRDVYRAEIAAVGGGTYTVLLDFTGDKSLAVFGDVQPNGDIVFTNLCDEAATEHALTLPDAWLAEKGIDREAARNTALCGANGLPVWQSYVLGLDPQDATSGVKASIEQTEEGVFSVKVEGLEGALSDLIDVKCELWTTDDLTTTFVLGREEQPAATFGSLTADGSQRFYRVRVKIYWK